jgi:PKD repeat protein
MAGGTLQKWQCDFGSFVPARMAVSPATSANRYTVKNLTIKYMKKIRTFLVTLALVGLSVSGIFAQTGIYTGTVTATEATFGLNETLEGVSVEVKTGTGSYYVLELQELDLGGVILPSFEMDNIVIESNSNGYTLSRNGALTFIIPEITFPPEIPVFGGQTFTNVPVSITLLDGTIADDILILHLKAVATLIPYILSANIMINFEGALNAPPVPDFTASETTISEGKTILFFDGSTHYPTAWRWYFEGGTPQESTDPSPEVQYLTAGIYDVKLIVWNEFGNAELIREDYITVMPLLFPIADFTANVTEIKEGETVSFIDRSQNNPESYLWYFEGGTPQESTEPNPVIVYSTQGVYSVRLTVKNENGENTKLEENYITVKPETGIDEWKMENGKWRIYPNPTTGKLRITNDELRIENVEIYDITGRKTTPLRMPLQSEIGNRKSEIEMDISHFPAGIYFLKIGNETVKVVKRF